MLSGWKAFTRGDLDLILTRYAPDCLLEPPPEWTAAGMRSSYVGHAAWREWAADWREAWERMDLTSIEIVDAGNPTVVLGRLHQRARGSGVELEVPYGSAYWIERGLIVRESHFVDRDETLRAAGISAAQETDNVVAGTRTAVPALADEARKRRTIDQRLYVRFPALYEVIGRALMRLSPQSHIRRLALARGIALAYAAFNRRDFAAVLVGHDPEIEYRPSPDLTPPDFDADFHGREGYLRLWRYWLDAFEDIRFEPEEVLDFGNRFVVTTQQRGRGSGSGVAVNEPVFQLFTHRGGLVVRQEDFLDRSEAIQAAQLSD